MNYGCDNYSKWIYHIILCVNNPNYFYFGYCAYYSTSLIGDIFIKKIKKNDGMKYERK